MTAVWTFDKPASGVGTGVPSDRLPIRCCWSGGADEAIGEVSHDAQSLQMATFLVKRKGTQSFPPLNDCPWGSEAMVMEREA